MISKRSIWFVSNWQYGFMQGRSTEDAIVRLRKIVNEIRESKYILGLLFDITGAFDNVRWPLVLQGLKERRCPANVFEVLKSYFRDRRMAISWDGGNVARWVTRGYPQGSVLGPCAWYIIFDKLLTALEEKFDASFVAYADELTVVVKGDSRLQIETRGQEVVDLINNWCTEAQLELSKTKTEMIYFKYTPDRKRRRRNLRYQSDGNIRPPKISVAGTKIKLKESVCLLGVHIKQNIKMSEHVNYLTKKLQRLFGKLRKSQKVNRVSAVMSSNAFTRVSSFRSLHMRRLDGYPWRMKWIFEGFPLCRGRRYSA